MRRRLAFAGWLVVVWVALWEDVSAANVASGLVLAGALMVAFRREPAARQGRFRPLAAGRFAAYFAWKLVEANAILAWEVVTPRNRINEGIVAIPIRGVSDALITVVANAISLTPGTLTIEADREPPVLYVHVLHLHDVEAVRREVQHLEALAIRAFGSDTAVRLLRAEGGTAAPSVSEATRVATGPSEEVP